MIEYIHDIISEGNKLIIKGRISSNCRNAHQNVRTQKVHFKDLPHRDELHDGTINLNIHPQKFEIIKNEYCYEDIDWGVLTEDFELVRVLRLGRTEKNLESIKGYLYFPSKSPNRNGGEVLEIWTTKIGNINIGDELVIEIPCGYLRIAEP